VVSVSLVWMFFTEVRRTDVFKPTSPSNNRKASGGGLSYGQPADADRH